MGEDETEKRIEKVNERHKRLRKAMRSGFYMEMVFVEYRIIEDYTEMILMGAGLWQSYLKKRRGHDPRLDSKIRYIQTEAVNSSTCVKKYFGDDLLDRILAWRIQRQKLLLASVKEHLTVEYVRSVAEEGQALTALLRRRFTAMKKACSKS